MRFKAVTRQKLTAVAVGRAGLHGLGHSRPPGPARAARARAAARQHARRRHVVHRLVGRSGARPRPDRVCRRPRALRHAAHRSTARAPRWSPTSPPRIPRRKDASTYTFHLRHGVKFSDGTPLTSADVVYSLTRVVNLNSAPSYLLGRDHGQRDGPLHRRARSRRRRTRRSRRSSRLRRSASSTRRRSRRTAAATRRTPPRPTRPGSSSTRPRRARAPTRSRRSRPTTRSC